MAMSEVSAMGKVHAEHGVAGFQEGEVNSLIHG